MLGRGLGFDRVRYAEIGDKQVSFTYFEEAFTSEHWMVRIYRYVHFGVCLRVVVT